MIPPRLPEVRHIPLVALGPFGFDLTMVWNRGVTFGLLSGDGPWNHLLLALLAQAPNLKLVIRGGVGMDFDVSAVPRREPGMTPARFRRLWLDAAAIELGVPTEVFRGRGKSGARDSMPPSLAVPPAILSGIYLAEYAGSRTRGLCRSTSTRPCASSWRISRR